MTREQIIAMAGAEIVLKFEYVEDGVRVHASFAAIDLPHLAIAIDYLQTQGIAFMELQNRGEETIQ